VFRRVADFSSFLLAGALLVTTFLVFAAIEFGMG
jgi:hypothetical protein